MILSELTDTAAQHLEMKSTQLKANSWVAQSTGMTNGKNHTIGNKSHTKMTTASDKTSAAAVRERVTRSFAT